MAKVKVVFPSMMIGVTAGEKEVEVTALTLGEVLDKLVTKYGDTFKDRILDSSGKPRRLLNFFVNGKNARFLKNLETPLKGDDEISILPIVSGG